jgi:NAD(P)-dependent dehydrogenase (short-subunit alcohol dehydrogenase family)
MLTVQWAIALEKEGFTVFSVSPGWLQTDLGSEYADLPVEVGVKAALEKILGAGKEQNAQFLNISIPGWEKPRGANNNFYDGANPPW